MTIYELVNSQQTHTVEVGHTVLEAAQIMVHHNIGAVPVQRDGDLVGIFSERDLMKRVVAAGRDPGATLVDHVMTEDPLTIHPGESVENCMVLMRHHGFRHLPVCDGKKLVGMVSLRDLILHDLTEKDYEVRMMRAYIQACPEI